MTRALAVGICLSALLVACASGESDPPDDVPACDAPEFSVCNEPTPSFEYDVAPIVDRRCNTCHRLGLNANQPIYEDYEDVFEDAGTILAVLHLCEMPPPGASMTTDERAVVITWLACGAPDN